MEQNKQESIRTLELKKFNDNASTLAKGKEEDLFRSVGYDVTKTERGYKGTCPECRKSFCHIGTDGRVHSIYWKCYDKDCPSNTRTGKLVHNLLGLVKGIVPDGKLGTAIAEIAKALGYEGRSFDITNGKAKAGGPEKDWLVAELEQQGVPVNQPDDNPMPF